ncbi:hypothetical protein HK102_007939, partial [Quaeritorhiza haematococci]
SPALVAEAGAGGQGAGGQGQNQGQGQGQGSGPALGSTGLTTGTATGGSTGTVVEAAPAVVSPAAVAGTAEPAGGASGVQQAAGLSAGPSGGSSGGSFGGSLGGSSGGSAGGATDVPGAGAPPALPAQSRFAASLAGGNAAAAAASSPDGTPSPSTGTFPSGGSGPSPTTDAGSGSTDGPVAAFVPTLNRLGGAGLGGSLRVGPGSSDGSANGSPNNDPFNPQDSGSFGGPVPNTVTGGAPIPGRSNNGNPLSVPGGAEGDPINIATVGTSSFPIATVVVSLVAVVAIFAAVTEGYRRYRRGSLEAKATANKFKTSNNSLKKGTLGKRRGSGSTGGAGTTSRNGTINNISRPLTPAEMEAFGINIHDPLPPLPEINLGPELLISSDSGSLSREWDLEGQAQQPFPAYPQQQQQQQQQQDSLRVAGDLEQGQSPSMGRWPFGLQDGMLRPSPHSSVALTVDGDLEESVPTLTPLSPLSNMVANLQGKPMKTNIPAHVMAEKSGNGANHRDSEATTNSFAFSAASVEIAGAAYLKQEWDRHDDEEEDEEASEEGSQNHSVFLRHPSVASDLYHAQQEYSHRDSDMSSLFSKQETTPGSSPSNNNGWSQSHEDDVTRAMNTGYMSVVLNKYDSLGPASGAPASSAGSRFQQQKKTSPLRNASGGSSADEESDEDDRYTARDSYELDPHQSDLFSIYNRDSVYQGPSTTTSNNDSKNNVETESIAATIVPKTRESDAVSTVESFFEEDDDHEYSDRDEEDDHHNATSADETSQNSEVEVWDEEPESPPPSSKLPKLPPIMLPEIKIVDDDLSPSWEDVDMFMTKKIGGSDVEKAVVTEPTINTNTTTLTSDADNTTSAQGSRSSNV